MSGFSVAAKMQALRTMLAGPLYAGLGYGTRGEGVIEVDDPGYQRQPLDMGEPTGNGTSATASNTNDVLFPPWVDDSDEPIRYWFVLDGSGVVVASGELDPEPDGSYITPRAGGTLRFLPGDITLGLSDA